ncbi:UNVERIFIED_CONTAM: hypothetical protein HDU68_001260 [Siphonaria sp. JEL0065]|nr:hypothetical protein HDU68_001260 [Siphonaria sp. JEL0065]
MAKKGKELNPADAHRKKLRKLELKKNKDDKKKKEQLQSTHKEALRLVEELQMLNRQEKEAPLDKANKIKKEKIAQRLDEINDARRAAGLPAVSVTTIAKPKPKQDDEESKWYHPTFNPHGPKKPKGYKPPKNEEDSDSSSNDDSESDSDSDSDDSDAENGKQPELDIFNLPLPEGSAPMEAQFYHNLDLTENRLDQPPQKKPFVPDVAHTSRPNSATQQTAVPIAYPFPPPTFPFPPGMPPPLHFPPGMPPLPPHLIPGNFPPSFYPRPFVPAPPPPHQQPPLRYQPGVPFVDPNTLPPHHFHPPAPPTHRQPHHQAAPQIHSFNVQQEVSNTFRRDEPPPAAAADTTVPSKPIAPTSSGPVVISVEPKMRDLQKELTQFVPHHLLKKQKGKLGTAVAVVGASSAGATTAVRSGTGFGGKFVVDAAPDVGGGGDGAGDAKSSWVPVKTSSGSVQTKADKPPVNDDEYEAFMKEIQE